AVFIPMNQVGSLQLHRYLFLSVLDTRRIQRVGDVHQALKGLTGQIAVQDGRESVRPTVEKVAPAIVNVQMPPRTLFPGLSNQLERSPIVQIPDDAVLGKVRSVGEWRSRPVLSHAGRVDD